MSTTKFIKLFEYGKSGTIQLNRPEALNAINLGMWSNMYELLRKLESQKDVVIVKGSGNIFCAGGDVKQLSKSTPEHAHRVCTLACKAYDLVANYRKPYVVLIDGLAMGGAAIYSMPGKYRIATERTAFSMPETAIGYFNDCGSSYFLSRVENNVGIYMGLTGTAVKGYDMKKIGLATHFIETHKLDELEKNLIKCQTDEDVDRLLSESSSEPPSIASELDTILQNIKKCFSGVTVEKIFENLQRDGSDWAKKTLKVLNRKSPTALKVSHRSITTGRKISLRDCLKMEMRLAMNHNVSDLQEGVRALLVDKDLNPKWMRKSIYEVSQEDVERFFRPLPDAYELNFDERIKHKL